MTYNPSNNKYINLEFLFGDTVYCTQSLNWTWKGLADKNHSTGGTIQENLCRLFSIMANTFASLLLKNMSHDKYNIIHTCKMRAALSL